MSPGGESFAKVRADLISHAKTLSVLVDDQRALTDAIERIDIELARREERDTALKDDMRRIEASVEDIRGLGKWLLAAVGAGMVTAIVTFVVQGGLNVGH